MDTSLRPGERILWRAGRRGHRSSPSGRTARAAWRSPTFPGFADVFTVGRRQSRHVWADEPSTTPILREVPDVRRLRDYVAYAQTQSPA
ncbi:hypothetical protein [Actinoplanes sp. NPDC051411]|uniref:hypothetical protein n=1 Tax=Actinoplanes sp. NPDC051411 TaxID=3155522 RepID=UPI00343B49D4